ncbi:MBL fold metallo-hydrolase [Gemmatimonas sp.]|uniref:MBL fold metallo-hydrolase n=1 Tax=Gemmatimonas sp. TaxID=1962908 RepID=UPI00398392D0
MIKTRDLSLALAVAVGIGMSACVRHTNAAQPASIGNQRLTVLVDAFGSQPALRQDWGYAALIEYGGKRILFDTGNDSAGFAENVQRLGVQLTRLDAVIISHRHGDHTAGLRYLLTVNPRVTIYVTEDEAFGGPTPAVFFKQPDPSLPITMRYFNGAVPDVIPHGSAWTGANFIRVTDTMEIAPGFRVVRNISATQQFSETPELSLVIDTPTGQIVVVGCSHPGVERIVASVAARDPHISMVVGGLHLVTAPRPEVERLAMALRDTWKVERIAPGHCSGELTFAVLQRIFGANYRYAGVGTVIDLS